MWSPSKDSYWASGSWPPRARADLTAILRPPERRSRRRLDRRRRFPRIERIPLVGAFRWHRCPAERPRPLRLRPKRPRRYRGAGLLLPQRFPWKRLASSRRPRLRLRAEERSRAGASRGIARRSGSLARRDCLPRPFVLGPTLPGRIGATGGVPPSSVEAVRRSRRRRAALLRDARRSGRHRCLVTSHFHRPRALRLRSGAL
jgi:hypothetical protein